MAAEITGIEGALAEGEKFLQLAESLPRAMEPWNQNILNAGREIVDTLYGQRLGALFNFQDLGGESGQLAHLRMSSDSPYILSYEFGIRPHEIWAHHTALKFQAKDGETLYRRMVHHPGTRAHNLSPQVEEQWRFVCEREWTDGLETLISTLGQE